MWRAHSIGPRGPGWTALLALQALVGMTLPGGERAEAGVTPFRRPVFYEGLATVAGRAEPAPVWLAMHTARVGRQLRTKLYGVFLFRDETERSRALGLLRGTALAGNLRRLNPDVPSGSFQGALGAGAISGTFTLESGATGEFLAREVTMDPAAMPALPGRWEDLTAREQDLDLEVQLNAKSRRMRAEVEFHDVEVADARGQWIVVTNGGLWLPLLDWDQDMPPGVDEYPLPSQPVPLKGGYRIEGKFLIILDPFRPDRELTRLERLSAR